MNIKQKTWGGEFGDKYTKRNKDLSNFEYKDGDRLSIVHSFFYDIPRDASILEIGCNSGNMVQILHDMGFTNITGIDINKSAIDTVSEKFPEYEFIHSSIELFQMRRTYDLVFTSGVLIHIHPDNLPKVIEKMKALSKKWIFGFEYHSLKEEAINYSLGCWSRDYPNLFNLPIKRQEIHMRDKGYPAAHVYYLL